MARPSKDYSALIGKKFGDRTVLSIIKKQSGKSLTKHAVCECKCGRIHEVPLYNLIYGRAQKCQYCSRADVVQPDPSNKLGIRYIYFDYTKKLYIIQVRRNGVRKNGSARTLSKAKQIKEQFLKEFENEMNAHD